MFDAAVLSKSLGEPGELAGGALYPVLADLSGPATTGLKKVKQSGLSA